MKAFWIKIKEIVRAIWKVKIVRILIRVFLAIFFFWLFFLNYVEPTEMGIARNVLSGKTWIQDGNGLNFTPPWVYVPVINTKPVRVEINSAGHGFSAKLVQFNKNYWEEFVYTEGVRYYWWSNRISFNLGYDEEHRGMRDILRGYAYSPKNYNFITIVEEYEEDF